MSDKEDHVYLEPLQHVSRCAGGITNTPGAYGVKLLGRIHYSGVAVFKSLSVWQDDVTKQIFWAEHDGDDELYPPKEGGPFYGCYVVFPDRITRFENFLLGWGAQYGNENSEERNALIQAVWAALPSSPTDGEIWCKWSRGATNAPIA